jgi:hypothetical protein
MNLGEKRMKTLKIIMLMTTLVSVGASASQKSRTVLEARAEDASTPIGELVGLQMVLLQTRSNSQGDGACVYDNASVGERRVVAAIEIDWRLRTNLNEKNAQLTARGESLSEADIRAAEFKIWTDLVAQVPPILFGPSSDERKFSLLKYLESTQDPVATEAVRAALKIYIDKNHIDYMDNTHKTLWYFLPPVLCSHA